MSCFYQFRIHLLLISLIASVGHFPAKSQGAQNNQQQLYRYFIVQAEFLDDTNIDKLSKSTAKHEAISLSQTCMTSNQVLFAVKASYPYRIDVVSDEIKSMFLTQAKKSGFRSIEVAPVSEITNFCK